MRNHENVVLINPHADGIEGGYEPTTKNYTDYWHPYGLGLMASHMRAQGSEGNITVLDKAVMTRETLRDRLRAISPTLIGISPTISSYNDETLALAEIGQEMGAEIYLGGSYATKLAPLILRNQKRVNGIIQGDGEGSFLQLAQGEDLRTVGGLVYRDESGEIVSNPLGPIPIDFSTGRQKATWTDMNYDFIPDLGAYTRNFVDQYGGIPEDHVFTFMNQRGCYFNAQSGGCRTCSRQDEGMRVDPPVDAWRRLNHVHKLGGRKILQVESDFLGDRKYFEAFYQAMPPEMQGKLDFEFMFARANWINDEMAQKLKDLQVKIILLGLESGDSRVLKTMRKGSTPQVYEKALSALQKAGRTTKTILSYIVGSKGDNRESLTNTLQHFEILCQKYGDVIADATFFEYIPLPGAEFYDDDFLSIPEMRKKYGNEDKFRPEIIQDGVKHLCPEISWEELQEFKARMEAVADQYLRSRA